MKDVFVNKGYVTMFKWAFTHLYFVFNKRSWKVGIDTKFVYLRPFFKTCFSDYISTVTCDVCFSLSFYFLRPWQFKPVVEISVVYHLDMVIVVSVSNNTILCPGWGNWFCFLLSHAAKHLDLHVLCHRWCKWPLRVFFLLAALAPLAS